ncbi:MAG: outer membrane beta-barrel protein, partial [Pseudomonadota bacterium]
MLAAALFSATAHGQSSGGVGLPGQGTPTLGGLNPALVTTSPLPTTIQLDPVEPADVNPTDAPPETTTISNQASQRRGDADDGTGRRRISPPAPVARIGAVGDQQGRANAVGPLQGGGVAAGQPFAPLGVRTGKFILRPAIETVTGFSSNSTNDVSGSGSFFVSVDPELSVESDFARHALSLQVTGGLDRFASGDDALDKELIATGSATFDIDADSALTASAQYQLQEDDLTGVADDPIETTVTAGLTLDHQVRQIDVSANLSIARNINDSFVDESGVTQDQDDLNSTALTGSLRTTLGRNASLEPFAEVEVEREIFDEATDDFGNGRNVTGVRALAGVEIDRGDKLNGEVAFGFGQQLVDGSGIDNFGGFIADFNLNWSPRRLTTVTLNGQTRFDNFPSVATPGDITYDFDVDVRRNVRENLDVSAGAGLNFQVDGGSEDVDTTIDARFGLDY